MVCSSYVPVPGGERRRLPYARRHLACAVSIDTVRNCTAQRAESTSCPPFSSVRLRRPTSAAAARLMQWQARGKHLTPWTHEWGNALKQRLRVCREPHRGVRELVFTVDRPRRIDRVIDFFGDRRVGAAALIPRLATIPLTRVCRD